MYPTKNRDNIYQHSSEMLAKGFRHQRRNAVMKLGSMHQDLKAMSILHAHMIGSDMWSGQIIEVLSKFLLVENVYFLSQLFNLSNRYSIAYSTLIRMKERLIGLLNRSLSEEAKSILRSDPDNNMLISLFHNHPRWHLYCLVANTLGSEDALLAPFRLYAEGLRYREANIHLRSMMKEGDQDGMLELLPQTRGRVMKDAIRYLSHHRNPQLSKIIDHIHDERGPNWFLAIKGLLRG